MEIKLVESTVVCKKEQANEGEHGQDYDSQSGWNQYGRSLVRGDF